MNVPKPEPNERERAYIERCVADESLIGGFENEDAMLVALKSAFAAAVDDGGMEEDALFKTCDFVTCAKIEDIDLKEKTMVVKISTESVDRDREVLLAAGCNFEDYRKNPVVQWVHRYDELPIAKAMWVKAQKNEVLSKPKFAPTDFAQQVFDLYANEFLKAWSVGFVPVMGKGRCLTEDDIKGRPEWAGALWMYEEWKLLEYSAVPVPSNPDALSLAVSKGFAVPDEMKHLIIDPDKGDGADAKADDGGEPDAETKDGEPEGDEPRPVIRVLKPTDHTPVTDMGVEVRILDDPEPRKPVEVKIVGDAADVEKEIAAWRRGRVLVEE